jgi:hypothetical protein
MSLKSSLRKSLNHAEEKKKIVSMPKPTVEPKRKKADRSLEARADRAENEIRLLGNCFVSATEDEAKEALEQIEFAMQKLRRRYNRAYEESR